MRMTIIHVNVYSRLSEHPLRHNDRTKSVAFLYSWISIMFIKTRGVHWRNFVGEKGNRQCL